MARAPRQSAVVRAANLAATVALALVSLVMMLAGCAARNAPLTQALASSPPAEAPAEAPHEGIKVHGHWTIEVRDPDQTLMTHREFENSLVPQTGDLGLANVLGRVHSVGLWEIGISNGVGEPIQPCSIVQFGEVPCILGEPGDTYNPNAFRTLALIVPTSGPNANMLVLTGTFTAQNSSPITNYSATFFYCPGTIAPASCGTPNQFTFFTFAGIPTINVSAGQFVQVTVVFSFS